ncbi:MAG: aminotransferase class V-fold PLP-dependent enzyme [Planctomycetota bacterium]
MLNRTIPEIYLDANATTPVWPEAAREAISAMEELFGNPSSSHVTGLRARSILEAARSQAKTVLGVQDGRVVFTSGATEAVQSAVLSALCVIRESRGSRPASATRYLLYGATEHKAVPQALQHWNDMLGIGAEVKAIPVDAHGQVDLGFLREYAPQADMVCTMAVNNETGVITDLPAVEQAIGGADRNLRWMVDCVQAIGKMKLDLSEISIDYAPVSGHKIYAPKGIGFLYVREGAPVVPLLAGGGQEGGARGGTENLPGVAAIARVLQSLNGSDTGAFTDNDVLRQFRDRLIKALEKAFPTIVFNTPFEYSVPTTINFSVKGFSSKEILDLFDAASIRVSSGSACGSALIGSYVLEAMGLPSWRSNGAIRLSFGPMTPEADVREAEKRIAEAGQAMVESCLMFGAGGKVTPGRVLDGLVQLKRGSDCSWVLLDAASRQCVIIDPFEELSDRIEALVRCQGSRVVAILDTHNHVDHQSCRSALLRSLADCALPSATTDDILGWPQKTDMTVFLGDGSEAECFHLSADTVIARTRLPGHTVDGTVLLVGSPNGDRLLPKDAKMAFTGDTILIGGIGRTDFYSSSASDLYDSLRRLPALVSSSTLICPTHDYTTSFATTLDVELRSNDLLARIVSNDSPISLEQFCREKSSVDDNIDDEKNCEIVCGHIQPVDTSSYSIDLRPAELPEFFAEHKNSLIVDVREPHEFSFAQDWDALGLSAPPENIPLTRLSDFLVRLMNHERGDEREIIFLCRSGSRSSKAAQVVRRLGFHRVWHIKGGIALGTQRDAQEQDDMEYII